MTVVVKFALWLVVAAASGASAWYGYHHAAVATFVSTTAFASLVISTHRNIPAMTRSLRSLSSTSPSHGALSYSTGDASKENFCVNISMVTEKGRGDVVVKVHRDWAPLGAVQFYLLIDNEYFDGAKFFRVLKGFMAQIGIHQDPEMTKLWRDRKIMDEDAAVSNRRGTLSFATAGPNTRSNQIFFNTGNNARLDKQGFAPFAEVVSGMDHVDNLYSGYGEARPKGQGPSRRQAIEKGNIYLETEFPRLSYIVSAKRMTTSDC